MTRKIEKEVTIDPTPEEAWQALADAELINRWCAPEARRAGRGRQHAHVLGLGFEGEAEATLASA
jgi:uncharacterized protein YndB with AHSA1/START domain